MKLICGCILLFLGLLSSFVMGTHIDDEKTPNQVLSIYQSRFHNKHVEIKNHQGSYMSDYVSVFIDGEFLTNEPVKRHVYSAKDALEKYKYRFPEKKIAVIDNTGRPIGDHASVFVDGEFLTNEFFYKNSFRLCEF